MADFWGPAAQPQQQQQPPPQGGRAPEQPPGVCRHFFSPSGCTRPDCAFLHIAAGSAQAPVCVFWLKGTCRNGAACAFRHTTAEAPPAPRAPAAASLAHFLPPSLLPALPQGVGEEEDQPLEAWLLATSLAMERLSGAATEQDFPALPGSAAAAARAAPPPPSSGAGGGLASRLALEALARAYPGIPPAELRQCLGASQGLLSRACQLVAERNPGAVAVEGALHPVRLVRAAPSSSSGGGSAHTARGEATARAIAGALDIVETGCSLARLYAACRGEAEALARSRNEAFERSSRAYASSQLAQARAYSAQGQALDRRMRAAHAAAAARIFEQRNEGGGGGLVEVRVGAEAQVRVRVWDLHGLHAAEAAPLVEEGLARASGGSSSGSSASSSSSSSGSSCEWVALLTGARSHSSSLGKGGGSLNAGLLEHLRSQGWRVYEPMVGVLCVHL
jgi:hypothetical protein